MLHLQKQFNFRFILNLYNSTKRTLMDLSVVTNEFKKIAPLHLAESWDNVGLLVEPSGSKDVSAVLFTNDLTQSVLDEALSHKADVIFSYHPPIFVPLKTLQKGRWKDRIILKCIEERIAVYSPHTALDAIEGGVNDWLISCFGDDLMQTSSLKPSLDSHICYTHQVECTLSSPNDLDYVRNIPNVCLTVLRETENSVILKLLTNELSLLQLMNLQIIKDSLTSLSVIKLEPMPLPKHGMGRLGKLKQSITLQDAINRVKQYVGLEHIRVALSKDHTLDSSVSCIAVCAGSGSSILKGAPASLYITGEMSHHDLLDASHHGVSVILCEHSNSERGFLKTLVKKLQEKLPGVKLILSKNDEDPIQIM